MYFWQTKDMATSLKERRLALSEKRKYALAWGLVIVLSTVAPARQFETVEWRMLLIEFFASVVWIFLCYRVNAKGDGRDFLGRFICISWPELIRILPLIFGVALFRYLVLRNITNRALDSLMTLCELVIMGIFFVRVYRFIKWTADCNSKNKVKGS